MHAICLGLSRNVPSVVIIGQKSVLLSNTVFDDFFFENLLYQKQCKYVINVDLVQIRFSLYKMFYSKKVLFHISAGRCLQFLE